MEEEEEIMGSNGTGKITFCGYDNNINLSISCGNNIYFHLKMMTDESGKSNSSQICRACLEPSEKMYPLQGNVLNVEVNIATMISYCTSEKVAMFT